MATSWSSQILGKYGLDNKPSAEGAMSLEDLPWKDQMDLKYGFITPEELSAKYNKQKDYAYVNEDPTRVGPREQAGFGEIAGKTFSDIGTTMLESGKDLVRRLPHMALQSGGELDRLALGVAAPQGPETEITPEQQQLFDAEDAAEKEVRAQRRYELEGALNTRGDVGRFIGEKVLPNVDNFLPLAAGAATGLLTRDPTKGVRVAQALAPIPAAKVFGLEYAAGIDAGLDPRERLRRATGQALVEWATERLPIGISGSTSALGVAGRMAASEGAQEGAAWVGGSAYDLAEALVSSGDPRRMGFLPDTVEEALGEFGESVALGVGMGGGIAAVTSRGLAQVNREKLEEEKLKKLNLPSVKPTGDKAFDAGQAAGVAAAAASRPVDLFGQPIDAEKQNTPILEDSAKKSIFTGQLYGEQPVLSEFDLEQRAAEAFRMSPAGREAKARELFQQEEAAKRKVLEDNALRTGIRNRLTGMGIDRNIPAQGGLFGQDTPANEAERARSASAEASRRTPRVLENDPEGPSEAIYSGGEVGPQVSEREAMNRATEFDTDRQLIENDAEAVVKNRKQFFGPLAEEAALAQARLEAKNASPEALKPFKQDGDTMQDLGDARERYAQAILPQTRKEEQERREKIYDRALDIVVTGRNRFATNNRGVKEDAPAPEQATLDFSGGGTGTAPTTTAEQPSLFTTEQAPVPATQPKPPEFKSRLTAERERISPLVEKKLKDAEKAEKAERTKAVNEEKAKEEALVAASIADVKKAQPDLKGDDLKNAVFARVEERRRTGNLPKMDDKKSRRKGPKNRLSKKEEKQAKRDEKSEEVKARVRAELEKSLTQDALTTVMAAADPEKTKRSSVLHEGRTKDRIDKEQDADTVISRVLQDPELTPELRKIAERLRKRAIMSKVRVVFASKNSTIGQTHLKKSLGIHIQEDDSIDGDSLVALRSSEFDSTGLHPIIVLHELAHAATVRGLAAAHQLFGKLSIADINSGNVSWEDKQLWAAYSELVFALGQLRSESAAIAKELGISDEDLLKTRLKDEKELIAYTYTDPDFRASLKKRPALWTKVIEAIRKLLGIQPKYANALEQIITLSERVEEAQDTRINKARREKLSDAMLDRQGDLEQDMVIPDISEMADIKPQDVDVVRHFDKSEEQLSPKLGGKRFSLGWFKREVATWLSSTGRDTAAAKEAKDIAVQERAGQFVKLSQSRNRMTALLRQAKLTPDNLTDIEALKDKHPAIYNEYKKVRQISRALGLQLAKDYVKYNEKNMTDKDWNVIAKVIDNDDYFRRTYKKNAPGGFGRKYAENLLRMASEHDPNAAEPTDPKKKAAYDQTKKAYDTVREAKQLLIDTFMVFPDTWDNTTIKHLRKLYTLWAGREPTGMKREEIEAALERYRDATPEKMNSMADEWVKDLLDLGDPNNKISSFYKPGSFNKSILIPRENVPEEIRNLWGENKDPLTKLYSTWGALATATAQMQYLNSELERGKGKFLFDGVDDPGFDRARNSAQITAQGMGPLSNLFTTPRYKETMETFVQAQEATLDALLAVRPSDALVEKLPGYVARKTKFVARMTKYLATVGSVPGPYILNAIGAPINMIMNGNFNAMSPAFYKSVAKSLKGMKDAIAAYERKEINEEALELLVNGILDSSFVGELQASERAEIEKELTSQGFTWKDQQKASWKDKGRAIVATATDVYAVMDLYAKAANYYAEKDFLTKFYKRRGIEKSEKQIQRDAAERTKRNNLTYTRAAAVSKSFEGAGLSMFLTYFGETWRTAYNNMETGINDIRLGAKIKDAGLVRHGMARVAGSTAALVFSKSLLAMYAVPVKFVFGLAGALFGGDDDRDKLIQEGMGDFYENRSLALAYEGENGNKSFFDVGRIDPIDPVTTPLRHIADGNFEEAWKAIADLYVVNTAVSRTLDIVARRALGVKEPTPTMANRAPAVYKAYFDMLTDFGASPRLANELIRASETANPLNPPFMVNFMEARANNEKPDNRRAMDALGLRSVDYDPVATVRSEYMRKVKGPTDAAMGQIKEYLQFGEELDEGAVEDMYLDAVANEYEGFIDASKAVTGALASGASRTSLREGLKQAGVSNEDATHLLNGRFVPTAFSDQFLDGVEAALVQKAGSFSEKAQARQNVRALKRQLKIINTKYRNFIPEE